MFFTVKKVASAVNLAMVLTIVSVTAAAQTANSHKEKAMFTGLQTVMIHVDDMEKAKKWYTEVLGAGPYFDEPNFYIGFHVGGYELGLHPADANVTKGGSTYVYWGTKDARAELARLLKLGAKLHQDVQDVGGGILVATVTDPWGNIFGVIENPHFKLEEAK
jgi:predicted enzyme related to lactoylglutathione lyase